MLSGHMQRYQSLRHRLRREIGRVMQASGRPPSPNLAALLRLFSLGYGAAAVLRADCYRRRLISPRRLPCKVLSIGNLTVGGTGKTPMTLYAARLGQRLGFRVAVLSRGYGGRAEHRGGVVHDGRRVCLGPQDAGDEPFMLALRLGNIPVIVGHDRYRSGLLAVDRFRSDLIVLDDGFQHLQLHRDVNLLLLDFHRPVGNGFLLPRGSLREPLSALGRSDALVLTRMPAGLCGRPSLFHRRIGRRPIFGAFHRPYILRSAGTETRPAAVGELSGGPVFAFSGIARNPDFRRTLGELGCQISGFMEFSDHHDFSRRDLNAVRRGASAAGCRRLVTTDKDFARIGHRIEWPDLMVVGVETSFGDRQPEFDRWIGQRLEGD